MSIKDGPRGAVVSAHTPGPWHCAEARSLVHVRGAGRPICSVPIEHIADARLISQAPELLEALRAFPEDPNPYTYRIAYAKARAAIAAATGETE